MTRDEGWNYFDKGVFPENDIDNYIENLINKIQEAYYQGFEDGYNSAFDKCDETFQNIVDDIKYTLNSNCKEFQNITGKY